MGNVIKELKLFTATNLSYSSITEFLPRMCLVSSPEEAHTHMKSLHKRCGCTTTDPRYPFFHQTLFLCWAFPLIVRFLVRVPTDLKCLGSCQTWYLAATLIPCVLGWWDGSSRWMVVSGDKADYSMVLRPFIKPAEQKASSPVDDDHISWVSSTSASFGWHMGVTYTVERKTQRDKCHLTNL